MANLVGQYEEYPTVPLPEPSSQDISSSSKTRGLKKYIYAGIVLVAILIAAYFFLFSGNSGKNTGKLEGNQVCDAGEDCVKNPVDCQCTLGKVCSTDKKVCVDKGSNTGNNLNGTDLNSDNVMEIDRGGNLHGNKICDSGENCFDDPVDCKCLEEEYCSDQKICRGSVCGNGKCELYEGPDNCCIDCTCIMPNELCNQQTKSCGPLDINLSEDRALEIASKYFGERNLSVESIISEGVYKFGDNLVRQFSTQDLNEGYTYRIGISETEEVIEIPTMP